jgi:germination protein M
MAKSKRSKKKRNNLKTIFILLILVVVVIFGYTIFNKFIVPVWEKYREKPVVTKEVPYEEEEIKEVEPVPIEEMVEVNLYFSDSQAMYLVPEKRKISQISSLARQAVIELIKGPESSDFYPTIPEGTQVNEVYIADDKLIL